MSKKHDDKIKSLEENGARNRTPEAVEDELFREDDFFDPHDLMQVKYEMVRKVEKDNWKVARAAKAFGYSRPFFYDVQKALKKDGLPGLIPCKRGPKAPHKLTENVIQFVLKQKNEKNITRATVLAQLVNEQFGFTIHPRSIERVLEKRRKKNKAEMMETNRYLNHDQEILIKRYEELSSQVLNNGILQYDEGVKNKGYVLFLRHGMASWLKAWSLCKELEPASPEEKLKPVNNSITDEMKYQAIIILANMALYSRKEAATLC